MFGMKKNTTKQRLYSYGKRQGWRIIWEQPYFLRIALTTAIGGIIYGYDTGIHGNQHLLKTADCAELIYPFTFTSILFGITFGHIGSMDGRPHSILYADFLLIVGAIIGVSTFHEWMVFVSRLVVGIGLGGILLASPIYLAEISPYEVRGALISTFYLFVSGGQFLAYLVSKTLSNVPGSYRLMLALGGLLAMAQFKLMNILPQSPAKLYRENKENAVILLNALYSPPEAEKEIETLESSLKGVKWESFEMFLPRSPPILKMLSRNISMRRGFVAGIGCILAQQLVGINFVLYYAPKLLELDSVTLPGLSILGSLANIFFVDTWGRRKVLQISIIGMVVSLWMLSHGLKEHSHVLDYDFSHNISFTSFLSPPDLTSYRVENLKLAMNGSTAYSGAMVPVGLLVEGKGNSNQGSSLHGEADIFAWSGLYSYIIFYSFGMGTVPWIINSEIYPYNYRLGFAALAALSSVYSNLFVGIFMWFIFEALGPSNTFALLSVVAFATSLFVFLLVPETKEVRIEEIESMLCGGKNKKETPQHAKALTREH